MYENKRTLLPTGLLGSQPPSSYVPPPVSMGLMSGAGKPPAAWVNTDKVKEEATQRYNQQQADQFIASHKKTGKIICNRWHELGYMDDETARLDQLYGQQLLANDRPFMLGYLAFARHIVARMHAQTWQSRLFIKSLGWLVNPWAQEMSHRMDMTRPGSYLGAFLMWLCHEVFVTLGRYRAVRLRSKLWLRKMSVFSRC